MNKLEPLITWSAGDQVSDYESVFGANDDRVTERLECSSHNRGSCILILKQIGIFIYGM